MVNIEELRLDRLKEVRSLHERSCSFDFPDLTSPLYLSKVIASLDNKVIGYGCLRLTSEAIIGVDLECGSKIRARATDALIRTGIYQCQKLGLKDMHAFLTGQMKDSFARVLEKRYGFTEHQNPVLVLEV